MYVSTKEHLLTSEGPGLFWQFLADQFVFAFDKINDGKNISISILDTWVAAH